MKRADAFPTSPPPKRGQAPKDVALMTSPTPDLGPLVPQADALCQRVAQTVITTSAQYTDLQEAGKKLKAMLVEIQDQCAPMVKSTKAAYDAAKAFRDQHTTPLKAAMEQCATKTGDWKIAQDRAREIAEAQERDTRHREMEAQQVEQAAAAEADGHTALAEAILEQPVHVPVVKHPDLAAPKVAGAGVKTYWRARLVCGHDLDHPHPRLPCCLKQIALIPRSYLIPDAVRIGQQGRQWGEAATIPGIEFYPEHKTSYSARNV